MSGSVALSRRVKYRDNNLLDLLLVGNGWSPPGASTMSEALLPR
jgi:hypothetical protein